MSLVEIPLGTERLDRYWRHRGGPAGGAASAAHGARARASLLVGLRPEALRLAGDGIAARVEAVEVLGADAYDLLLRRRSAGSEARITARADARVAPAARRRGAPRRRMSRDAHLFDPERGERLPRPDRRGGSASAPRSPSSRTPSSGCSTTRVRSPPPRRPFLTRVRRSSDSSGTDPRTTRPRTARTRSAYWPESRLPRIDLTVPSITRPTGRRAAQPVVALSQSGKTPDVVNYVERARRRGALTIAVTNEPTSELAEVAEIVVPLNAGPERAVAATKTYVNQLGAIALLADAIGGRHGEMADGLRRTAELIEGALDTLAQPSADAARPLAFTGRLFAVGRGVEFATAREVALKLTETCRIAAEPLTTTDLAHGPVAALDPLFPVWAVATRDPCLPTVLEAAWRVRAAGAFLIASGDAAPEVEGAAVMLPLPEAPIPVLSPLLSIIPGQLVALVLAEARGLDPDKPAGLDKVTLAA